MAIMPRTDKQVAPLSYAQQRLWFLQELVVDSSFYTESSAIHLRAAVDPVTLERTLNEIVRRHEVLRTTFHERDGEVFQRVLPEVRIPLAIVDLSRLDPTTRRAETSRLAIESSRHTFDLSSAPLMKVSLLRLGRNEWVFLLGIHHIVCDGWSTSVFSRELSEIYTAFAAGRPSPLPPLDIQYADFAAWQRDWLSGGELQSQIAYWREQLADLPILDLPTDSPRPAVFSYDGSHQNFTVPHAVAAALQRLSQRHGATLFMTLLAGFGALLHRHCGQDDVVVGCPIANRMRHEVEQLIGFFVNTLVLRVDASDRPSFDELIERVRRMAVDAYTHQDVPFEKLVEELHPRRDLSRNPLFQTLFQLRNAPGAGGVDDGTSSPLDVERSKVKFDLRLDMFEGPLGLQGVVEYSTDVFTADRITRLIDHFQIILAEMARDPSVRIGDVALVAAADARTLARWGRVTEHVVDERTIFDLFVEQAAARPDAIAVVAEDRRLSYSDLRRRSERLANHLRRRGVAHGSIVGVSSTRSLDTVVAILAIVECGAAYMPLDPDYPNESLSMMLRRGRASIIVAPKTEQQRFAELLVDVIDPDLPPGGAADQPSSAEAGTKFGSESLAYVMFTSGSTGEPKGVSVPHRAVVRLVQDADYARLGPEQVVALLAPLTFDATTLELWGPLLNGGRLVIAPDGPLDPTELHDFLAEHEVTTLWLTAGLFHFVADRDLGALATVQQLITGGDVIKPSAVAAVIDRFPSCRVINGYGPTENTTFSCCHPIDPATQSDGPIPIGHPISGSHAVVLDDLLRPCPVGVPGELHLGGAGLAWGYLDDPRATAERFVPNPYASAPGGRMYRSGDLVQWSDAGELHFLGRSDRQLKIRGFRVEPGEIEAALEQHPAVATALVVAQTVSEGRRLAAYIVPAEDAVDGSAGGGSDLVSSWRELYDGLYGEPGSEGGNADYRGWMSSLNGEPIPLEEMHHWLNDTVERILACAPRRVLEIGAGSGLVLNRVAPYVDRYVATDLSDVTIDRLRTAVAGTDLEAIVELHAQPAIDFDGLDGPFDLVILNSVVQYFPSSEYARSVMESALERLTADGHLFVGDVRSLAHLEAFHLDVSLAAADADGSAAELLATARRRSAQERELVLEPAFFDDLGTAGTRSTARWKRGDVDNELFRYRYDVLVGRHTDPPVTNQAVVVDWADDDLTIERLRELLAEPGTVLHVRNAPNERTQPIVHLAEILRGADQSTTVGAALAARRGGAMVSHAELIDLAEETSRHVFLQPADASRPGRMHAAFVAADSHGRRPLHVPFADVGTRGRRAGPSSNRPDHVALATTLVPELRELIAVRLPAFMAPSAYVLLDEIPLTANGKVRRDGLPPTDDERPVVSDDFVSPRNDVERAICSIWAAVIGVDSVGVDDNFFELGGDSIQCIQIIARARAVGCAFTAKQLFEHQTVGELAHVVERPGASTADQGPLAGRTELLPAQLWFLMRGDPEHDHFNQSVMLELPFGVDAEALDAAITAVVDHHDALRLAFSAREATWDATFGSPGTHPGLERHRLQPGASDVGSAIEAWATSIQTSLDIGAGRCFRAALLDTGRDTSPRLLLAVHHLVVDGVSWRILLEDLWNTYSQVTATGSVELPPKTNSVRDWAERLAEYASEADTLDESSWWLSQVDQLSVSLPLDGEGDNRNGSVESVFTTLDPARTRALLTRVPSVTGAHIDDVLVAALAVAVTEWTGHDAVSIDLEGHGREDIAADIDLSRTVGWFTSIGPVRIGANADAPFLDTVRSVGSTLAERRHRGIGFGALRYLSSDRRIREGLAAMPDRPISFNYLGQLGRSRPDDGVRGASESAGPMRDPHGRRVNLIEVDSNVSDDQLSITWHYCRDLHHASTIQAIADNMCRVLKLAADEAINSTHDFSAAGVDRAELDAVLSRLRSRAESEET